MVVKTKMADISLVSRVRQGKNSKKTTQRATSAIWKIFADLNNPKRVPSRMNLTSMVGSMF